MTRSADPHRILRQTPYFADFEPEALAKIAGRSMRRSCAAGETVFWAGDEDRSLYLVESGWLKVYKLGANGREQVLHFVGPGEAFNALSVFSGAPNPASVTALEDAIVWQIPRTVMLGLLETHPAMSARVIQDLSARLQRVVALVEDISLYTVEERLARLLLAQSRENAIDRQGWATQSEIAARLGTVPDVLNRTFRKFAEQGLIEVSRSRIRLLDVEGLERTARGQ